MSGHTFDGRAPDPDWQPTTSPAVYVDVNGVFHQSDQLIARPMGDDDGTDAFAPLSRGPGSTTEAMLVSRVMPGGRFIFDQPDEAYAVWGEGQQILMASGESLYIVAS